MERLERLINLVIALRETRRPLTAAEIRDQVAGYGQPDHEAFRRMFERDKSDLRALGVPVETASLDAWGDRQGYRIDPGAYDLPDVAFEPDELAALAVAIAAAGLSEVAAPGLRKLVAGVGVGHRLPDRSVVGVGLAAPHLESLAEAQVSRTPVRFAYRKGGGPEAEERTVDPYALVHRRGRWYLVGRDHDRDARRAFRLDRIDGSVDAAGAPGAFDPPDERIGIEDVVPAPAGAEESVAEVAAAPEVAWLVAREARGGGRRRDDGWTVFEAPVADPDRFVTWALSFGPELEVLGPPPLRERVRTVLAGLAEAG